MDITKFNDELITDILKKQKIIGIIGGPPCQRVADRLSNTTEKVEK